MLRLKAKGYEFPELEAKGWLNGWTDDNNQDMLSEISEYKNWTM